MLTWTSSSHFSQEGQYTSNIPSPIMIVSTLTDGSSKTHVRTDVDGRVHGTIGMLAFLVADLHVQHAYNLSPASSDVFFCRSRILFCCLGHLWTNRDTEMCLDIDSRAVSIKFHSSFPLNSIVIVWRSWHGPTWQTSQDRNKYF